MPWTPRALPEYPQTEDLWDALTRESRPIVVYGMGNGAEKLKARFDKYGIRIADFFASDGFVRGQSFLGYRVKSFSEIKETYPEFVIVVSFASNRAEVIELVADLDRQYELYIPDMPVAGEEYFDHTFFNENYQLLVNAINCLNDEESRSNFASAVWFKLTGKLSYLMEAWTDAEQIYSVLEPRGVETLIDAGAYNGDTVREAIEYFPALRSAVAIEPDPKTFKRLLKYVQTENRIELTALNRAVWSDCTGGSFISSGNRNSSVSSTASHQHKLTEVALCSVDSLGLSPDFIKYDVEGAEMEALAGSLNTINSCTPRLLVSVYHRSRDLFEIINFLASSTSGYKMYLRRRRCFPAWELALLLVPEYKS